MAAHQLDRLFYLQSKLHHVLLPLCVRIFKYKFGLCYKTESSHPSDPLHVHVVVLESGLGLLTST